MAKDAIASLALLKACSEQGSDYVSNFIPFANDAIYAYNDDPITLSALQHNIYHKYCIRIPQNALKTILSRMAKEKYILVDHGTYRKSPTPKNMNLDNDRASISRKYEHLINTLCEYCSTQYKIQWSHDQAEAALLDLLDKDGDPILAAAINGGTLDLRHDAVEHSLYVASAFVLKLYNQHSNDFLFLEEILKGKTLANSLLYPNISEVKAKFDEVHIYFDTNIVLRMLGYSGDTIAAPCLELLELLTSQNAMLHIFEDTFSEVHGILLACAATINDLRKDYNTSETLGYFIDSRKSKSDIELMIATLSRSLERLNITIKQRPQEYESQGLDEKELESSLESYVNYKHNDAMLHDLKCISAIHRLRRGHVTQSLEHCDALFVTNNSKLMRASTSFFKKNTSSTAGAVPYCMIDSMLATLAWLKQPMAKPGLPAKQLIADCCAALNPSNELWNTYLEQVKKLKDSSLITDDDYSLLKYSNGIRKALAEYTFGDVEMFSEGTIQQVLEHAQNEVRKSSEQALEKTKMELEDTKRRKISADEQNRADWNNTHEKIQKYSSVVARILASFTMLIPATILTLALFYNVSSIIKSSHVYWEIVFRSLGAVISWILSLKSNHMLLWRENLREYIQQRTHSLISNKLGIPPLQKEINFDSTSNASDVHEMAGKND